MRFYRQEVRTNLSQLVNSDVVLEASIKLTGAKKNEISKFEVKSYPFLTTGFAYARNPKKIQKINHEHGFLKMQDFKDSKIC